MGTRTPHRGASSPVALSHRPQKPGLVRRVLHLLALDPEHAAKHLAIRFLAGGLAYAVLVAVYALAGLYHIDNVQLNLGALVWSGLIGTLIYNGLLEKIVFRGIIFRLLERGLGSIAALVLSSIMFAAIHLLNPGASLMGAFVVAIGGGVIFSCAFLLTRSLWLAIGLHWAADFWQGQVFGLHPSGQTSANPLLHSTVTGPHLWTGGICGGGLIALMLVLPISAAMMIAVGRRGGFRPPPTNLAPPRPIAHG